MSTPGERPAKCLDSLLYIADGMDTDDPVHAAKVAELEKLMTAGNNLISSVLECEVTDCTRTREVRTLAGILSLDGTYEDGECIEVRLRETI